MSDERPPGGMGWIPLSAAQGGEAWAEIRPFGGKLFGLLRMDMDQPAVFVSVYDAGPVPPNDA